MRGCGVSSRYIGVAIVICLVLVMCTLTILGSVLCVLMVEGMPVVVNVILSLMKLPVCFRGELNFLNCNDICM